MRDQNERRILADYGVHFPPSVIYAEDAWRGDLVEAVRANRSLAAPTVASWAMDAQPSMVTTVNAGIPSFLANILDPEVIKVILGPLKAADVVGGETKKGDWTTQSLMMPMAEPTGNVVTYGDYDNGGMVDANVGWVSRQPWNYQSIKAIGEKELAQWGLAAIDMNGQKDYALAQTFSRVQNWTYFYGVSGLQNYGLLNDPSLPNAISPVAKTGGGFTWPAGTAEEIYKDFIKLFNQLQTQMGGNLEMTDELVVALSTSRMVYLETVTSLTLVSVSVALKNAFPRMRFVTAPQYTTGSGELMQMWVPAFEGQQTAWCAFTEKMRGHPIVQQLSAWMQKFSAGTWGAIIRRPVCVAQMLGI